MRKPELDTYIKKWGMTPRKMDAYIHGIHYNIYRDLHIGRLNITTRFRKYSPNSMGRFGGGWEWCLGIKGSGACWQFSFFTGTITFSLEEKNP